MNGLEFRRLLRSEFKYRYTSIGCYPLFLLVADGGCLCYECAHNEKARICLAAMNREPGRNDWAPVAIDVNWEDPDLECDECGARIESAYAEPDPPHPDGPFQCGECGNRYDGTPTNDRCPLCTRGTQQTRKAGDN